MDTETSPADLQRLQRRKDDLLAVAVSAERQVENIGKALAALGPDELRGLDLPTVNYHDLLDAGSALSTALKALRTVQAIAEKHGAVR